MNVMELTLAVLLSYLCSVTYGYNYCTIEDNGQNNIEIDSDGETDWLCKDNQQWSDEYLVHKSYQTSSSLKMGHVCMDKKIPYPPGEVPNSGPHREAYAAYGEYRFVPPGRYIHNLEHGAVVFMYHPCAPESGKTALKEIARSCTWKHLITNYGRSGLNETYPYAIVIYGHVYHASAINRSDIENWIRSYSQTTRLKEKGENGQGTFNDSLLVLSQTPVDPSSQVMCPEKTPIEPETSMQYEAIHETSDVQTIPPNKGIVKPITESSMTKSQPPSSPQTTTKSKTTTSPKTTTLTTSKSTTVPKTTTTVARTLTTTTIKKTTTSTNNVVVINNTTSAVVNETSSGTNESFTTASFETGATPRTNEVSWAIGSLLFIVAVLALAIWKTKLLRRRAYGNDIETSKIWRDNAAPGSFSVAAIIRKLPDVITRPNIAGKNGRYEENTTYSLIQDEETSSDDEL